MSLFYTGLLQVEAPWVKMALYCDDIYIIPGQVDAIPCQAINISYMMFIWCILYQLMGQVTFECSWVNDYERSLILHLFSNMSQWVELDSIMIGWYGHKNRLYLLVHFTNENLKTLFPKDRTLSPRLSKNLVSSRRSFPKVSEI